MQKTILTICFTLSLGLLAAATASAALMQYSGGGSFHSIHDGNAYGIDENTHISWSVTFDSDWAKPSGWVNLGEFIDQGASLTIAIGDWLFTHDQDNTGSPGNPQVQLFPDGNPRGFSFTSDLGADFAAWSRFYINGESVSFESTGNEGVHGTLNFRDGVIVTDPGASAVPIPGAVWLLGSGLLGLLGLRRKLGR